MNVKVSSSIDKQGGVADAFVTELWANKILEKWTSSYEHCSQMVLNKLLTLTIDLRNRRVPVLRNLDIICPDACMTFCILKFSFGLF